MDKIELPPVKKVGHLTLLRSSHSLTRKELNALPFEDRLAIVQAASGRQKYELLIDTHDAERLVRRLPAQEIFLLIKELGLSDVPELLGWIDTDQFTAFLDLDCWQGDVLDGRTALEWLAALHEVGEEKVFGTIREMEPELPALILKKVVTVVRGPEDHLDDDARMEASQRDGGFELAYLDSETGKLCAAILDIFLRRDPELFAHLLGAMRWEQEALLEEETYQLRIDRLRDMGFPDPTEALAIYAWLDPATFDPADWRRTLASIVPDSEAPAFMLAAGRPRDLLAEVLAGGIDGETAWELTFLLNTVMTADRVDVGSFERVQEETGDVYRNLNIALEYLCGDDAERAARLFRDTYLQPLYRLGFSLTLALRRRAVPVKKSAIGPFLDGPFRALVDALDQKKPRFFEGIENVTRGGERPFGNLHDLRLAGEWLDRLEVQRRLFERKLPFDVPAPAAFDLDGCTPDLAEDLTLSDLLLTALANRVLGRAFLPHPIPAAELITLHGKVCAGGKVIPELRRETAKWLDTLEPGAGAFGHYCLDLWEEDLCALEPEAIDPRFLTGVIIRLG